MIQNLWNAEKPVLRGKLVVIQAYLKKQAKNLKQPNLISKVTRKRRNKTQVLQKERNNKYQTEINKIDTKETIEKLIEMKSWFFENKN